MNPNRGRYRRDHVLQRASLPLHLDSFRIDWRLAADMTGRHRRLPAMLSHMMAARVFGIRLRWTGQQTRHGRRRCPQQGGTQHNGSSYAIHSHEFISLSIALQQTGYRLVGGCAVTGVTAGYPPRHLKKLRCRKPRRHCFYVNRHFDATGDLAAALFS
jgi:hypothetical protein